MSERRPPHRVLLVDDSEPMRVYVREMLADVEDVEVIGEAADGAEAVRMVEEGAPDVVLMDVTMPVMDGMEASAEIKERFPNVLILMLSLHKGAEYISQARDLGVEGYLAKDGTREELTRGLLAVARGETLWGSTGGDAG